MASFTMPEPEKFIPLPDIPIPLPLLRLLRKPPPWGALAQAKALCLRESSNDIPPDFFLRRLLRKAPVPDIRIPLPVLALG